MSISVFEIIGPIMVGPSSSHTAGMARLGLMAHHIIGFSPEFIELILHPALRYTYQGHRTDAALIGGLMGITADDIELRGALNWAKLRGIHHQVSFCQDTLCNPNTVTINVSGQGQAVSVRGVSVGGGSICIDQIDHFSVALTGASYILLLWGNADVGAHLDRAGLSAEASAYGDEQLYIISSEKPFDDDLMELLHSMQDVRQIRLIPPALPYGTREGAEPLFTCYAQLLELAERSSIPTVAIAYEANRSGKEPSEIRAYMAKVLGVMKEADQRGQTEPLALTYGLASGKDGKLLAAAAQNGTTLSGYTLSMSIARALGIMEVNGSMGCVVASPTAGSCGIIPGCLLTLQEERGLTDDDLIDALFTAAIVGVVMHFQQISFSGVVGGCQGEIGVSSAMAAAALTYLGGGDAEAILHSVALSLKNLLGLICDPIAGPIEVPCIKRNSVGVANAFAAADMALAGIRSFIPPDEVLDALRNVQELLPRELKGTTVGGLACTQTAIRVREHLRN